MITQPIFLVNGKINSFVDVTDRALQYGDGLFETIAVSAQQPIYWQQHWQRFITSCQRLQLPLPDEALFLDEIKEICRKFNVPDKFVLKIIYTRGLSSRSYRMPIHTLPTRIMSLAPWPNYPKHYQSNGIKACWCKTRLGHSPALAGMKHLNRLEQVLARSEWSDPDIAEGIVCDYQGNVIEGTMSNLFLVQNGQLITPKLDYAGVEGVLRSVILDYAKQEGMISEIRTVSEQDVHHAEELFLCNSIIGIWPIIKLDGKKYNRGPITRYLQGAIKTAVKIY